MMNVKVIGLGAAGNKAAIKAVTADVLSATDILLLNTTAQDIPVEYKQRSVIFESTLTSGGCGKERSRSRDIITTYISDGRLEKQLKPFIDPGDLVVIVTSTEGGTGSGAAPLLAGYVNQVVGIRPQLIAFTGTEDDIRGLSNTVEFFKECAEMCGNCVVQSISNKKFMTDANGNKLKAETMANDDFVKRIKILQGSILRESSQNIDAMDHKKLVTTPGYMSIDYISTPESIDTVAQFNDLCAKMIENSKSLSTSSDKLVRLGIILIMSEDDRENVDWQFEKIKSSFAEIGEVFMHVQDNRDETRQIIVIMAGMEMPIKFVISTFEKFKTRSAKLTSKQTDFASSMATLNTNGSMFDIDAPTTNISGADFLNKIKKGTDTKNSGGKDLAGY